MMVLAFITVVGIVAGGVAYLSSGRRRAEALSMSEYRAFQTAASAVDYAARVVTLEQLLGREPTRFLQLIADDDERGLNALCSSCSEWRKLRDPDGKDGGRLWTSWTFPASQTVKIAVDALRDIAKKDPGVAEVPPVVAHPLRFRRALVAGRWQNLGVVRFESTVVCQDAFGRTALTLRADRMFTVQVEADPKDGHLVSATLTVDGHNLRTGVKKA